MFMIPIIGMLLLKILSKSLFSHFAYLKYLKYICCQTLGLVLRLRVDFVLPLSQQQEQEEQEEQEEPPPNISAVTDPILTKL